MFYDTGALSKWKGDDVMPTAERAVRPVKKLYKFDELSDAEEDKMWDSIGKPVSKEAAERLFS